MTRYPRDFHGYGPTPPDAQWPGGARIAVQFVLNYEEGGENCLLHGDAASEAFLSEIVGAAPWPGQRHWNMESIYDYGARAGFWRLHRLFTGADIPVTVYGVATALALVRRHRIGVLLARASLVVSVVFALARASLPFMPSSLAPSDEWVRFCLTALHAAGWWTYLATSDRVREIYGTKRGLWG